MTRGGAGTPRIAEFSTLDGILREHAAALGPDATPYRNHACRVANLCAIQLSPSADALEKIAVAAAFHDLGIWTDRTFDYLGPSVRLVSAWLAASGRASWTREIAEMIVNHHKVTRYRGSAGGMVEPFRRADWVDVTRGVLTFGVSRSFIAELYARWPSAGFHRRLVQLELRHLRQHPLNPLPVLRF